MISTEIKSAILADYTRYKAKHQGVIEAISDHEHGSINEIYFSCYRIAGGFWAKTFFSTQANHLTHSENLFLVEISNPFSVYIWTLFGISWLVGLISLIINSASKVTLKTLPKNFKNREEKNCTTYSESEQLCK